MIHIVFICTQYLPNPTASGIIVNRLVNTLRKKYPNNLQFSIITKKSRVDDFSLDSSDHIRVNRISTPEIYLSSLFATKKGFKKLLYKLIRAFFIFIDLFRKTSINPSLVKKFYSTLKQIDKQQSIDVVVPLCFPFESVVAANKFSEFNNNVTVFPYLIDKFSYSQTIYRIKINEKLKLANNLKLEYEELNKTTKVMATYDWNKIYKKKLLVNSHRIYLPLINTKMMQKNALKKSDPAQHSQIFFAGSLSNQMRPIKSTSRILKIFFDDFNQQKVKVLFFVNGNTNNELDSLVQYDWFSVKFNQAFHDANIEEARSDFLLSIGNIDIQQIPSKIFEYITTLKPIIHVYQDYDDPVISVLKSYPNSCLLDGTVHSDSVSEANKLVKFIQEGVHVVDIDRLVEQYSYADFESVSDELFNVITEVRS